MIKARCYFDYLNCLLSITPEGAGVSFCSTKCPIPLLQFFLFNSHFMLAGERAEVNGKS